MPGTLEAVIILVLLVAPGFLCSRLITTEIPRPFISEGHSLFLALIFSILIHVIILPFTVSVAPEFFSFKAGLQNLSQTKSAELNTVVVIWLVSVLFIVPLVVAYGLSAVWKSNWAQPILERFGLSIVQLTPQAWDWFFITQRDGCWIVAELEDGTLVGGEYAKDSFVSLSPHSPDLFLERAYYVDEEHNFGDEVPDSVGVWVNGAKINKLHFYRVYEGE